jgi:hypothetical protein
MRRAQHEGVESLASQTADYLAEYITDELGDSPSQFEIDRLIGRTITDFNKVVYRELHAVIDAYYGISR